MRPEIPESEQSTLYCLYRVQARKRFDRGEEMSKNLTHCLRECNGYDNTCKTYTPLSPQYKP